MDKDNSGINLILACLISCLSPCQLARLPACPLACLHSEFQICCNYFSLLSFLRTKLKEVQISFTMHSANEGMTLLRNFQELGETLHNCIMIIFYYFYFFTKYKQVQYFSIPFFFFLLGVVSMEEFEECCQLLNQHMNSNIPGNSIKDLARSIDMDKDGCIDFNEFLEAFRLVNTSKSVSRQNLSSRRNSPVDSIHIIAWFRTKWAVRTYCGNWHILLGRCGNTISKTAAVQLHLQ